MNNGQVNQHGNFQSRSSLFWAFYQTIVSRLLFIRFISHSISPLHWGALACPNKEIYAGHQLPAGWRFHRRHARLKTVAQPLLCCSLIFLGSKAAATRILEFQWSFFFFSSNISALTKVIADLSLLDKSFPCHCEISSACLLPQNKGWWTSKTSWTTTSQCRTASWTILLSVWIQRWIAPTATQGLEWQKPLLNTFLRRCYKR